MYYITYEKYLKYFKQNSICQLAESDEPYEVLKDTKIIYEEKIIQKVDQKHDKMVRKLLSNKEEMIKFLNQFLELEEEIKEENMVQCPTEFITKYYENRRSDIIYGLKDKPIYFLVEHQSTVDRNMPERIAEYVGEIMRKSRKKDCYPIVIPIVIYTGFQKWNVPTNLAQKQYKSDFYEEYKIYLKYNLIAIQNYTFEELIKKKTLFSNLMIIEKCKTKEELLEKMNVIIKSIQTKKEKEILSEIINHIITPLVGEEKVKKMLEIINKKEEVGMSPLTKMLLDLKYEAIEKGREKGMQEGIQEGRKEGEQKSILETVKNMIREGEKEEKIMKYTGISKKKLENIKGMLLLK